MKRDMIFRGLTSGSGKWVFGDLIHLDNETLIAGKDMAAGQFKDGHIELQAISVWPQSIGQFTGLHDKNGKEIYEGDIILKEGNPKITKAAYLNQKFTVQFDESNASFKCIAHNPMPDNHVFMPHIYMCFVIGNIHENPELIK